MNPGPEHVHISESNWNFWMAKAFNSGSNDLILRLAEQPNWSSIIMVKFILPALGARHIQKFREKAAHHPAGLRLHELCLGRSWFLETRVGGNFR